MQGSEYTGARARDSYTARDSSCSSSTTTSSYPASWSHETFIMASNQTRLRVIALYKELHRLGRDYPDPAYVMFL